MKFKKELSVLIFIYLITRIFYISTGGTILKKKGFLKENYERNYHLERKNSAFIEALYRWDAPWYLYVAEKGYKQNLSSPEAKKWKDVPFSAGFLPLFPYLIKFFKQFLGSYEISGIFLSFIFGLTSIISFYFLIKKYIPDSAFFSSLIFIFYPPSIFLSLPYAEGLFLTLLFLFFLSLEKEFIEGYLLLPLLILTRPQGFYTIILFLFFPKTLRKKIYLILLFFLGCLVVFLIFYQALGSFMPFIQRQSMSRGFPLGPWHGFIEFFLWKDKGIFSWKGSWVDLLLSLIFLFLIFFSKERKNFPLWTHIWTYIVLLFPLCSSFLSYQRLILPAFPIFGILGKILNKKIFWIIIPLLFLIQFYYFYRYVTFQWVS